MLIKKGDAQIIEVINKDDSSFDDEDLLNKKLSTALKDSSTVNNTLKITDKDNKMEN